MTSNTTGNANTTNPLTPQQREALAIIVDAVLDAVKAAGDNGAPGGVIYVGLMTQGCTFSQFESLMSALVRTGKLRHDADSHLYFIP